MEIIPEKYRSQVTSFITDKVSQRLEGLPHQYTELASQALAITKKIPLNADGKNQVVNYIYQQVSSNDSNGFKPEYDITSLIAVLQSLNTKGCGCFKLQ